MCVSTDCHLIPHKLTILARNHARLMRDPRAAPHRSEAAAPGAAPPVPWS